MKKLTSVIAAVLTAGTLATAGITANACGAGHGNRGCHSYTRNYTANNYSTAAHYFVDANKDGICDSCGGICLKNGLCSGKHSHTFVDANNDGICDSCGYGICLSNGQCGGYYRAHGYFIDCNNDGKCDNCGSGTCLSNGLCGVCSDKRINFVDTNGDGICDNCAAGQCVQHGTQASHHRGWGCRR